MVVGGVGMEPPSDGESSRDPLSPREPLSPPLSENKSEKEEGTSSLRSFQRLVALRGNTNHGVLWWPCINYVAY